MIKKPFFFTINWSFCSYFLLIFIKIVVFVEPLYIPLPQDNVVPVLLKKCIGAVESRDFIAMEIYKSEPTDSSSKYALRKAFYSGNCLNYDLRKAFYTSNCLNHTLRKAFYTGKCLNYTLRKAFSSCNCLNYTLNKAFYTVKYPNCT